EGAGARAPELADADAGPSAGDHRDAEPIEKEEGADRGFTPRTPPADRGQRRGDGAVDRQRGGREPSTLLVPPSQVEENEGGAPAQTEETDHEQDVFDEQHRGPP